MSMGSWVRRTGVAVAAASVLVSLVGGSPATATVAAVPSTPWAWGSNQYGQLGNGTSGSGTDSSVPVKAGSLSGMTAIAAGDSHSLALKSDGTVWAWGLNQSGQLGSANLTDSSTPVQVCAAGASFPCTSWLTGVTAIGAGTSHSLAVKSDGTAWTWGDNSQGQLGQGGTISTSSVPVQVSGLTGATAVAGGGYHSLAVKSDGTAWAWGWNAYGQLGNADPALTNKTSPVQVCAAGATFPCTSWLTGVTAVAGGYYVSMAVKSDGTAWDWGFGGYGQLGDGSGTSSSTPVQVCAAGATYPCTSWLIGVTGVAANYYHSLAVKSDGTAWAWGDNSFGGLGDGSVTATGIPVQVCAAGATYPCTSWLTGVTAVAAGIYHSLAVKSDGTAWAWGQNYYGQLGQGGTLPGTDSSVPVQVSGLTGVTAVASGVYHSMALAVPIVSGVSPIGGPAAGGTPVTITGKGFTGASSVSFGGNAATGMSVINDTTIQATSPAGTAGATVDVRVTTASGISGIAAADKYTYTDRHSASSTQQYTLIGNNGTTWFDIDATNLATTVTPAVNSKAILGANVDLFTNMAGYNQDIGIFVRDNGVDNPTPLAWKESGGFAGTYSPNAAFVQSVYPMTAGHTYIFKLKWKTNKPEGSATIYAGAGSGLPYSPTSLTAEVLPTTANPYTASSTQQYTLIGNNGTTWFDIDATNLLATVAPTVTSTAILAANVDLFTNMAGYNQDIGIFVSDNGVDNPTPLAWKESGGFAGTYSPNAAFVQSVYAMTAGHFYAFKLKWKTNKPEGSATIYAAAGGSPPYSPTRLTISVL